jgi:hypothetical protein
MAWVSRFRGPLCLIRPSDGVGVWHPAGGGSILAISMGSGGGHAKAVIAADDVARYSTALPDGNNAADVVAMMAPPFSRFFVDILGVPIT